MPTSTPETPRMTVERIARLRELLAGAAALPWTADNRESWDRVVWSSQPADDPELVFNVGQPLVRVGDPCGAADEVHCNLIAEGISALPDLLDALAASQQEVEALREQLRLANIDAANNEADASDLRTSLALAQKDGERLDWLERRHAQVIPCQADFDQWDGWNIWDDITHKDLGDGETLREAIDTARSTDAERSKETQ